MVASGIGGSQHRPYKAFLIGVSYVNCTDFVRDVFWVGMYEEPWRGRNLVVQITQFFTHSMIKPLPREFQCSTWSDSSRAMLSMSTSRTLFTSYGLVPKYAGTCMTSPLSRSRRNTASARVCTRIDLQKQQQHKKVSYWHNRLKKI